MPSHRDRPTISSYGEVVLWRIRHILMAYRLTWSGSLTSKYEWGQLADDIDAQTGVELSSNSLQNFARGLKKGDGDDVRPSRIRGPEKLEAIVRFLTEPDSKGYFTDRQTLLNAPELRAPLALAEFLCDQAADQFETESLLGSYSLEPRDDDEQNVCIDALLVLAPNCVSVDVSYSERQPLKSRHYSDDPGNASKVYSGFAVAREHEHLTIFCKCDRDGELKQFSTIASVSVEEDRWGMLVLADQSEPLLISPAVQSESLLATCVDHATTQIRLAAKS